MVGDDKIDALINTRLKTISDGFESNLSELKDVMTIPVERLQMAMTEEGFISYCRVRSELLDIFSLVEVLVSSADGEVKCIVCGEPAEIQSIGGSPVLKGEVTHWVERGRIVHDFTCDKCAKKQKDAINGGL